DAVSLGTAERETDPPLQVRTALRHAHRLQQLHDGPHVAAGEIRARRSSLHLLLDRQVGSGPPGASWYAAGLWLRPASPGPRAWARGCWPTSATRPGGRFSLATRPPGGR